MAELKIWRGQVAHEKGLNQLSDYLDRLNLTEGYLVIFDHSAVKTWHYEWITHNDKKYLLLGFNISYKKGSFSKVVFFCMKYCDTEMRIY
jgi:hypothetical protein